MNHRYIAIGLLLISILGIGIGYLLLRRPDILGLCPSNDLYCLSEYLALGIAKPLYWSIRWLPLLFFALIFVRKEVFWTWTKFIWPFAVIGFLLILSSPNFQDFFTPSRTEMTDIVVKFLVGLSAIPIVYKYWQLKKVTPGVQ